MIPFILVNILYAVPVRYISGYYFDWSYLKALIKSTITLQVPAHLWFIFVVFILDVLCSILAKGKKLYHKGVLPFVLVLFLISGYFSRINAMMLLMKNALWFIMGIWFEKHGIRKKMQMYLREKNRNRFVLSASCFMLIAIVLCQNAINLSIGWLEPLMDSLFIIVSAPIGGLGTYALSDIIVQRGRKNILIDYLSKQSFGIYLFHEPVIHLCVWLYVKTGFVNEMTDGYAYLLSILIRFSVSMAAGILISEVVHNLSIRNIGQHLK